MNIKISTLDKQDVTLRKFSEYLNNVQITGLNFIQNNNTLEPNELIDYTAILSIGNTNNISIGLSYGTKQLTPEQDCQIETEIKKYWNKFTMKED